MYELAFGDADYSFLYVDMTQRPKTKIRFEQRLVVKEEMNQLHLYDGTIVPYAASELAAMLTRLIAQGQTSCIGNDGIGIGRVDSVGLLLVDVA